jgi:exopolysaccharide biosynthesis polyprenyl glycosylphosphotransferase
MIRRHAAAFQAILMAADALVALVVVVCAAQLRFGPNSAWTTALDTSLPDPRLAASVFIATWIGLLWMRGLYRSRSHWTMRGELGEVIGAAVVLLALTLSALFLFKLPDVSRLLLLVVFPLLVIAAFTLRVVMRLTLLLFRRHGRNVRYMLVLGANAKAKAFANMVESHPELGLVVIGHLKAGAADDGVYLGRPLLGSVDDLERVLHSQIVDEVAICLPFAMEDLIEQAAQLCQQEGKVVRIPVAPVERVLSLGRLESIDGVGVYSLANGPDRALGLVAKRIIDVVGSGILMLVLAPLMALLALLVRLDSSGPILFRQDRVGLQGRTFTMIKFRSMCCDAEQQVADLRVLNAINGHAFKLERDPRVTRLGRFLRRTSLDELPQLWNVLHDQMSLVGPRPPLPCEVADYDIWHRRRLSMKPGMTGLWQIGARREPEFDHWVEKDLEYIDSWSLWLDLKIMVRTPLAMLSGEGR